MRFRYFDSGGNEVSLSTAAALAVKIDLGEVTETTLLYDAACDEWAPAGEQEIYRHILEHGAPEEEPSSHLHDEAHVDAAVEAESSEPVSDVPEPVSDVPEPVDEAKDVVDGTGDGPARDRPGVVGEPSGAVPTAGPAGGTPSAPPLEDFWGPAMSTSPGEEEALEEFDLSLEDMSAGGGAEAGPGGVGEGQDDLSLDIPDPPGAAGPEEAPSSFPAEPTSDAAEPTLADLGPGPGAGDEPLAETPEEPAAERPAAASAASAESAGEAAARSGRGGRGRDESLARLEEIAREAALRMEQEEAARRRKPGPTLGDRMAEGARKGGQRTGEALKSGATASARALSEGGKATAETLGAGMRTLGKKAWKTGPKIRRGLAAMWRGVGSGAAGFGSVLGGTVRRMRSGAAAAVRGVGVAAGFLGRAVRTAVLAPIHGAAAVWRMLAPVRGRAGRDARKVVRAGARGLRRAVFSPLALGLVVFVALFFFFTYGGGREAGEELWEATVGIARSVAAETDEDAAGEAAEESGEVVDGAVGPDEPPSDGGAVTGADPETDVAGDALATTATDPAGDDAAAAGEDSSATDGSAGVTATARAAVVAEFERELALASESALQDMIAGMDSLERAYDLPSAPPEEWLGGYYLAHASEFHSVRQYWARYRGYIRSVKAQDAVFYRRGLEARFAELGVPRDKIVQLTGVAEHRFREGRARRDSLYDAMAAVAEAAVDLHDFLAENEAGIEYDPVRPGRVSRAPVLEAYATSPEVKTEMDAHLDRILETMERVHGLRPVFTRELQDVLFSSLQAVEAVDTFRLGPRDPPPDSGGPPPGG